MIPCPVKHCKKKYKTISALRVHLHKCGFNQQGKNVPKQPAKSQQELGTEHHGHNVFIGKTNQQKVNDFDTTFEEISKDILSLKLTEFATNIVFKSIAKVVESAFEFSENAMRNSVCTIEVLDTSKEAVLKKVQEYDSRYKRETKIFSSKYFVMPEEYGIGTHWELKKSKEIKCVLPKHLQSIFQFVPITQTLKSLFERQYFREMYFDYNSAEKSSDRHTCTAHKYVDFCCGTIFKQNELFQMHPNSIQIQIFLDGFEPCDGLKPKAGLHGQLAIYFTLRNIPNSHSFNLKNIFLVAMCNANDLKTKETDYNNVWNIIVRDLKTLETEGIEVNTGEFLKGLI